MIELEKTVEQISKVSDFSDLSYNNINKITEAIKVVEDFNSKIKSYGKHIFNSMFKKSILEWKEELSSNDFKKVFGENFVINEDTENRRYVVCYKTKTSFLYDGRCTGWMMGAISGIETFYTFKNDTLIVTDIWETQEARFDHIPWIRRERRFIIDYKNKQVTFKGDML